MEIPQPHLQNVHIQKTLDGRFSVLYPSPPESDDSLPLGSHQTVQHKAARAAEGHLEVDERPALAGSTVSGSLEDAWSDNDRSLHESRHEFRLSVAMEWLDNCQYHSACRDSDPHELPHRVIDVDGYNSSKSPSLFVNETHQRGHWVALSHCWGEKKTLRTTRQNLDLHKQHLEWAKLPRTYQDAMTVTKALGFRYLWIDSLCIVQDDGGEDFHNEAAKMCDIYRNSALTISAARASSDLSGFLERASAVKGSYEAPIDHKLMLQSGPIHTRAWTFQETILPRRLLSFGTQEMYWECENGRMCECNAIGHGTTDHALRKIGRTAYRRYTSAVIQGRYYIGKYDDRSLGSSIFSAYALGFETGLTENHLQSILAGDTAVLDTCHKGNLGLESIELGEWVKEEERINTRRTDAFYSYWRRVLVPEYTRRQLRFAEDRLVALQAIATDICSGIRDEYVAGLWYSDLYKQMCWVSLDHRSLATANGSPSWSWASISGAVAPYLSEHEDKNCSYEDSSGYYIAIIGSCECIAKGPKGCGRALTGDMNIIGSMLEATLCWDARTEKFVLTMEQKTAWPRAMDISFSPDAQLHYNSEKRIHRGKFHLETDSCYRGTVNLFILKYCTLEASGLDIAIILVVGQPEPDEASLVARRRLCLCPVYTRLGIGRCKWTELRQFSDASTKVNCYIV